MIASRRTLFLSALALTLAVALAIGVWAEFADLGQPVLVAVGVPAIAVATMAATTSLAQTSRGRALAAVASGALLGTLLGVAGEGSYLALHFARGGELNFEAYDSQRAMALALLGIHTLVGLTGGLVVGGALAAVFALLPALRSRTRPGRAMPWTA